MGPSNETEISLIVPTLNEAENLPVLLPRIDRALTGRAYEVLIVDDNSTDATVAVCAELAQIYPLRLLTREVPKDGLGGAVLHGMAVARGTYLVVMDADLQHPPERLPDLLTPLENNDADFVLGSRYVAGGSTGETWSLFRKINSHAATAMARPFAGRTNDPMSGFFALRRKSYLSAERLTPLGYKIGLELMCKCRVRRVCEVPIHFAQRTRGRSKLTLHEQFRYVEHLSRLYDFSFPRVSPIVKFTIVVVFGWFVGESVARSLSEMGMHATSAVSLSYLAALLVEAIFHRRYIRTKREFILSKRPWSEFLLISAGEWIVCLLLTIWAASLATPTHLMETLTLAYAGATLARYVLRKELMADVRGLRRDLHRKPDDAYTVSPF